LRSNSKRDPNLEVLKKEEEFRKAVVIFERAQDAFIDRNNQVTIDESEKALAIIEKLKNKYQ